MKILISEDDSTSRSILAAILRKLEHDVVVTCNGAEAWQVMQLPEAPRLVILDWSMPEMDGLELCQRIRAMATDQPPFIIMLTSRDSRKEIVMGLDAGADDYLVKPYDPEELRARVNVGKRMVDIQCRLADRIKELNEALEQINTLRGIIPICSGCKKIRDDKGYWNQVEVYVSEHSDAEFSHGLCPDCFEKAYTEVINMVVDESTYKI